MEALRKIKEFSRAKLVDTREARTKHKFESAVVRMYKRYCFNHWRTYKAITYYREVKKVKKAEEH